MDEHPQTVCLVPQDVVGAPSDNHAGTFFCQLTDQLVLHLPEIVGVAGAGSRMRKCRCQKSARRIFSGLLNVALLKSALSGDLLQDFVVVARDAQLFGNRFADGSSAASKLTADGDDSVFYVLSLLRVIWFQGVRVSDGFVHTAKRQARAKMPDRPQPVLSTEPLLRPGRLEESALWAQKR